MLGWNQLFERVSAEWMQDIQRYQLPRILQGVGPVYHVTQLCESHEREKVYHSVSNSVLMWIKAFYK